MSKKKYRNLAELREEYLRLGNLIREPGSVYDDVIQLIENQDEIATEIVKEVTRPDSGFICSKDVVGASMIADED